MAVSNWCAHLASEILNIHVQVLEGGWVLRKIQPKSLTLEEKFEKKIFGRLCWCSHCTVYTLTLTVQVSNHTDCETISLPPLHIQLKRIRQRLFECRNNIRGLLQNIFHKLSAEEQEQRYYK